MEENRKNKTIKILVKLIFAILLVVLFAWLLSIFLKSNFKNEYNNVFQDNLIRMKEAGISYFTNDRLPSENGQFEKITLGDMYDLKLILEIRDVNGKLCSSSDSYVKVTKNDEEYQMKVYLSCDGMEDYIISYLGCYNYCNSDICEKKDITSDNADSVNNSLSNNNGSNNSVLEYEYSKDTSHWGEWSSWSKWTKNSLKETDYRKVETKVVQEEYTYSRQFEEIVYANVIKDCPAGYNLFDSSTCYKLTNETTPAKCLTLVGHYLYAQEGINCYYRVKSNISNPVCSNVDFSKFDSRCMKVVKREASCPIDYLMVGGACRKAYFSSLVTSCPVGYDFTDKTHTKCYKKEIRTEYLVGYRDVNYYRYATREYVEGVVNYKWSRTNNDKNLLNQGYSLTGRTRTIFL